MRRRLGLTLAAALTAAAAGTAGLARPATARADMVLPDAGGVALVPTGVINATGPSVSNDGRWVVYGAQADPDESGVSRRTVMRTDLHTGDMVELSSVPDGMRPGDTILPRISGDGCVVVAISQIAYDLFRDDDRDARWDVYRLVVPECGGQPNAWELVSAGPLGTARDSVFVDSPPTVSGSGAVIAYVHQSDATLYPLATITVVDATIPIDGSGRNREVAGVPVEAPARAYRYRGFTQPSLSQNGRHLAFTADADAAALLPGWGSGHERGGWATTQVYVWDRLAVDQTRAVHLVSAVGGSGGAPAPLGAHSPVVSGDGRVVAFVSPDRDLVPAILPRCDDRSCPTQVFRFDRDTDGNGIFDEPPRAPDLALVSAIGAGRQRARLATAGDASSWAPALTADGSAVAFVTDATNLVPSRRAGGGAANDGDLLVAEYHLGELRRVLDGEQLVDVPGAHGRPALSATGQVVVFDTLAGRALAEHVGVPDDSRGRALAVTTVTPQLALAELDFGSVLLAFESAELFANVQNAGPGAYEPGEVVIDNPAFRITGGSCTAGIIVAAGESCSVKLVFNPTAQRGYSGILTVHGRGGSNPSVSAAVRGAAGDPALLATPGGVDIAAGEVGGLAGRVAISIENVGFVPVVVDRVEMFGKNPGDFVIVSQACTGRALNARAACAVEVEFRPVAPGYRSALLRVATSIGQYTTAVLGGYAYYAPTFATAESEITAGHQFGVGGNGFPPESVVRIGFDDGGAPLAEVTTRVDGTFLALLDMPGQVRGGRRRLVATGPDGAVAVTEVLVRSAAPAVPPGVPGYGT